MNATMGGFVLSITLLFGGIMLPSTPKEPQLRGWSADQTTMTTVPVPVTTTTIPAPVFRHGDISWLPELAAQAGWPEETWEKLGQIILRESGGCPNRRGGDVVDENCNITSVASWNHRSDTGLLQINGVNYDTSRNKWARVCLDMGVCEQEPLLDPLTNLKAGYVLYTYSGWDPWDPCTYGPKWAHMCKQSKKP